MRNKPFPYYKIDQYDSFAEFLLLIKEKYSDKIAFRTKWRKNEEIVTFSELYDDVAKLSQYFSDNYGKENRIAVIGENSYMWIVSYFATVCSGNIIVPIDKELSVKDIEGLLSDCDCRYVIYSDEYEDIGLEICENIFGVYGVSMSELQKVFEEISCASLEQTNIETVSVIVYTSGTTGQSKGIMLSQKNICEDTKAACKYIELYGRSLAVLPFHHTFSFTVSVLASLYYGVETLICYSLKNVDKLIKEFKPTYLVVVPMFIERIDKNILAKIEKSGKAKLLSALNVLCELFDVVGIDLRGKCFLDIKTGLGGKLDFVICGGAPIDQAIVDRFDNYGIKILNGYGISECSPVVGVNRRYHNRPYSIGQALPGVNVRIDNPDENGEGEICVKGDIVMLGYYNLPEENKKAIIDGWFHTGDIGKIDKDGFIYITGRIKNLIILSNGKNVAPEELENLIARIPGVEEVLVYEQNKQLTAEIYPEKEYLMKNLEYFEKKISDVNEELPLYKAISKIVLREKEFEKTTTKKIKRINCN